MNAPRRATRARGRAPCCAKRTKPFNCCGSFQEDFDNLNGFTSSFTGPGGSAVAAGGQAIIIANAGGGTATIVGNTPLINVLNYTWCFCITFSVPELDDLIRLGLGQIANGFVLVDIEFGSPFIVSISNGISAENLNTGIPQGDLTTQHVIKVCHSAGQQQLTFSLDGSAPLALATTLLASIILPPFISVSSSNLQNTVLVDQFCASF